MCRYCVLHRGGRAIQVISPGRGHTGGDVLVFLPSERIVVTGDFPHAYQAYLTDFWT